MNKTARLNQHRERLIFLNSVNHYTQSGNAKIEKYFKLLKEIQKRIFIVNNFTPINPAAFFNPIENPVTQVLERR